MKYDWSLPERYRGVVPSSYPIRVELAGISEATKEVKRTIRRDMIGDLIVWFVGDVGPIWEGEPWVWIYQEVDATPQRFDRIQKRFGLNRTFLAAHYTTEPGQKLFHAAYEIRLAMCRSLDYFIEQNGGEQQAKLLLGKRKRPWEF
jgi:hypothetical protein